MDLVSKVTMRSFIEILKDEGIRTGDVFSLYNVKQRAPVLRKSLTVDFGSGATDDAKITYVGENDGLVFNQSVVVLLLDGRYQIVVEKAVSRCFICEGENPLTFSEDFKYCPECGKRLFNDRV